MDDVPLMWILDRMPNERFPYRIRVLRDEETLLALRAQDSWPGAGSNYFCLRDRGPLRDDRADLSSEVERVPVVAFDRYGARLAVVLDRPRRKRCDFLFLERESKSTPGERYEQIFWRTEAALKARRTPSKLTLGRMVADLTVIVDSRERYGWRFPGCASERRLLAVGDYALLVDGKPVAVVERKTLENLLAEFGRMPAFHQVLGELEKVPGHALVIEADYARILDPRSWPQYSVAFRAQAIAEIFALHPALRVVFAGNRKLANAWTRAYFAAWKEHQDATSMPLFARPPPAKPSMQVSTRTYTPLQGQYLAFIHHYTKVNGRPPAEADMQRHFGVSPPTTHQMVKTLEARGLIVREPGKARSIRLLMDCLGLPDLA